MIVDNPYAERKWLRALERTWSQVEIWANRIFSSDLNPLYHLGTLSNFLLIILTVTGLYLTIFYRPGEEVAYATVQQITDTWFGSLNRSVHRYASDGFLLLVFIHALKMFVSDRFWGSRWLAWVSGWAMVVISWLIGTMGYWLVWDQRAQWLTEYMINNVKGAVAITFVGPEIASASFAAFVIVLFVHIFLPLAVLVLIIIHILRLTRARILSPRWLLIVSTLALILLSLWQPAQSAAPANLDRLITSVDLDAWYLGFLPVIDRWGSLPFWGFMVLVFGVAVLAPWIARGRHQGPAVVENPNCTGCALCAAECPYKAIEMHYREDDTSRFKSIAMVNEDLCTGCGLCVGTCATLGIELQDLPVELVYEQGLKAQLDQAFAAGKKPTVVFTCQRLETLNSLPDSLNINYALAAFNPVTGVQDAPVFKGSWQGPDGAQIDDLYTCVLPCVGMVDVDWIKEMLKQGAKDVVIYACAYDDCNNREGPKWTSGRLQRRRAIVKPNLHWLEAAPGDQRAASTLFESMAAGEESSFEELPPIKERNKMRPKLSLAAGVMLFLTLAFAAAVLPLEFNAGVVDADQSQIRLLIQHPGKVITDFSDTGVVLPEGATVDAGRILGGQRHPVNLQLYLDGVLAFEENFEGRGLRNEGEIEGMTFTQVPPGSYEVELLIQDDGGEWRSVYNANIQLEAAEVLTFVYNQSNDSFFVK